MRHVTWQKWGTCAFVSAALAGAAGGYFVRATCGGEVSRTTLMLIR